MKKKTPDFAEKRNSRPTSPKPGPSKEEVESEVVRSTIEFDIPATSGGGGGGGEPVQAGTNSGAAAAAAPETLNLPAVLWDKPAGSKTKVPPPVPPRSPKRPLDHVASGAFEVAAAEASPGPGPCQRGWSCVAF